MNIHLIQCLGIIYLKPCNKGYIIPLRFSYYLAPERHIYYTTINWFSDLTCSPDHIWSKRRNNKKIINKCCMSATETLPSPVFGICSLKGMSRNSRPHVVIVFRNRRRLATRKMLRQHGTMRRRHVAWQPRCLTTYFSNENCFFES